LKTSATGPFEAGLKPAVLAEVRIASKRIVVQEERSK